MLIYPINAQGQCVKGQCVKGAGCIAHHLQKDYTAPV